MQPCCSYVMVTVEQQGEESCTSKPCAWLAAKRRAPTAKINEIEFKKYKYGYTPTDGTATTRTPAPSTDDSPHKELFNLIKENADSSALCTMLGKDGSSTDSASEGEENYIPPPFIDRLLYKGCIALVSYTSQERACIEKLTQGQASCQKWFDQRKGRITASILHEIIHMKADTDKGRICAKILDAGENELNVPAVKWGRNNEVKAVKSVLQILKQEHTNVRFKKCGYFISEYDPYFGASPDGIIPCDCCEERCLEIKCPFSLKEQELKDPNFVPPNNFCLEDNSLKTSHAYYTQVQALMAMCGLDHSYFALYTKKSTVMCLVGFNVEFWISVQEDMRSFYKSYVVPASEGKFKRKLSFD